MPHFIRNASGKTIKILGATGTCNCMVADELPMAIPPGESRELLVRIRTPAKQREFHHSMMFYTDYAGRPEFEVRFSGVVVAQGTPNQNTWGEH